MADNVASGQVAWHLKVMPMFNQTGSLAPKGAATLNEGHLRGLTSLRRQALAT